MGFRNRIMVLMALGLTLANGGCTGSPASVQVSDSVAKVVKNAPEPIIMQWAPGEVVSVISIDPADGDQARQARRSYLDDAFGLAGRYGLQRLGVLPVRGVAVGGFKPGAIGFYSWPGAAQSAALESHPQWPAIKARRPEGWDELRIHDVVVDRAVCLSFDPAKTYTMASAWINPERPADYDQYLHNITSTVERIGGRFIFDMRDPAFESHASDDPAPGRVVFVEWDSAEALAALQDTQGFKDNVALLQSGTTRFELLVLGHPG